MIRVARWPAALKRLMYRGGRPNALMRAMNRLDALTYASRWLPGHPVFRILRADGSAPDGHGSGQG
ncbi:hypothetical protein [Nonomuraea sp. NPDC001023]|uniref:hypothetical protein n=1 Tax=unclassified Nonomuraea TaxID=2593643 RepID=UPI00331B114C